jgi:hypothetical protein
VKKQRRAKKSAPRPKAILRRLVEKLGTQEIARRTGYRPATIARAVQKSAKISSALASAARAAEERSVRAAAAAKTRALKKTRLPESIAKKHSPEKLAHMLGRSERSVRRWIARGGAPKTVLDAALQIAAGSRPYDEHWEHGQKTAISKAKEEELEMMLRRFVNATRMAPSLVQETYRDWRRAKLAIRKTLTRAAWSRLIEKLGKKLGLPDVGAFSIERFKKS